jgi:NADH-quinone oxidoreductase subunit J
VDHVVNQAVLFVCLVVAGLGVALALPRRGISPQVLGAIIAAVAMGTLFAVLGYRAAEHDALPPLFFYVFAAISLGSALRVITHPRPVYSAIYFIATILSSSALFLIMEAEFMAFALIIIYAGAILITYLFVIMLATQPPTSEDMGESPDYDAHAREPMLAAAGGAFLVVIVSFMIARGLPTLRPNAGLESTATLTDIPRKIIRDFTDRGLFKGLEKPTIKAVASGPAYDPQTRTLTLTVTNPERFADSLKSSRVSELFLGETGPGEAEAALAALRAVPAGGTVVASLPESLEVTNAEGVGFDLIAAHPMALELAGVILLMAMIGAVVLARKQIELTEDEKAQQARTLAQTTPEVVNLGPGAGPA